MARSARVAPGGWIYHVLNRSVGRMKMFHHDGDYSAFAKVVAQAAERHPIEIFSYCVLANHWHFVVRPKADSDLSAFFRWLSHTHAMRWRVAHRTVGYGHLYQGRFKSFPVQSDGHFLAVCRYVERNALSAKLVTAAEDWRWCSLWMRENGSTQERGLLSPWPVRRPAHWHEQVNAVVSPREREQLQQSLRRGRPFGDEGWTARAVQRLGLEHTIRSEGRPPKKTGEEKKGN